MLHYGLVYMMYSEAKHAVFTFAEKTYRVNHDRHENNFLPNPDLSRQTKNNKKWTCMLLVS